MSEVQQVMAAYEKACDAYEKQVQTLRDERDRLRANLVNCVARLEAYYGEDYPAVRDAKAVLTPAGGGQDGQ